MLFSRKPLLKKYAKFTQVDFQHSYLNIIADIKGVENGGYTADYEIDYGTTYRDRQSSGWLFIQLLSNGINQFNNLIQ